MIFSPVKFTITHMFGGILWRILWLLIVLFKIFVEFSVTTTSRTLWSFFFGSLNAIDIQGSVNILRFFFLFYLLFFYDPTHLKL